MDKDTELFDFTKKRRQRSGGEDLYDDTEVKKPEAKTNYTGAAADVSKTIQSGGSGGDVAATGLTSMGVATANPYLVAAGLGMGVLSASKKKKAAYEQAKYEAEIARKKNVTDSLFRMSQSMGAMRL